MKFQPDNNSLKNNKVYIFFCGIGKVKYDDTSTCLFDLNKDFRIMSRTNKNKKKQLNVSIGAILGSIAPSALSRINPNTNRVIYEKIKTRKIKMLAINMSSNTGLRFIERK